MVDGNDPAPGIPGVLSPEEQTQVEAAIAEAESRTEGELVVCVADRSASHDRVVAGLVVLTGILVAVAFQLFWPRPAYDAWATAEGPGPWVLLVALLGGMVLGLGIFGWGSRVPLWLIPHARQVRDVHEAAAQAFIRFGIEGTRRSSGVLIYLSIAERGVIVLADEAVAEVVEEGTWDTVRDAIVGGFRTGRVGEGLLDAVRQVGQVLAEVLPGSHENPDELDNTVRHLRG